MVYTTPIYYYDTKNGNIYKNTIQFSNNINVPSYSTPGILIESYDCENDKFNVISKTEPFVMWPLLKIKANIDVVFSQISNNNIFKKISKLYAKSLLIENVTLDLTINNIEFKNLNLGKNIIVPIKKVNEDFIFENEIKLKPIKVTYNEIEIVLSNIIINMANPKKNSMQSYISLEKMNYNTALNFKINQVNII